MASLLIGELRNLCNKLEYDLKRINNGIIEEPRDWILTSSQRESMTHKMGYLHDYLRVSIENYYHLAGKYGDEVFREMIGLIINLYNHDNCVGVIKSFILKVSNSSDVSLEGNIKEYNSYLTELAEDIEKISDTIKGSIDNLIENSGDSPRIEELLEKINRRLDELDRRISRLEGNQAPSYA